MSGERLLILGASGHGKVVGDCAMAAAGCGEISYFDDRWPMLSVCGPWPVVGTGDSFFAEAGTGGQAFVAIGNAATRLARLHRLKAAGISVATVIHPRSVISPHASIGAGALVVAGAG